MPPQQCSGHSSSRTQPLAQRRARTDRACNFCRIVKQRCQPSEYGATDRPCRRCLAHGLDCNLSRATRSQSPSSGLGAQGPGPIRHTAVSRSASGITEELAPGSETHAQYPQQSRSVQVPTRRWTPLAMQLREGQDSSTTAIVPPGQISLQRPDFLPATPAMERYEQSYPNVTQGSSNLEPAYYAQGYYEQTTRDNTYIPGYPTNDGAGYSLHNPHPEDAGDSGHEHEETPPYSGDS